MRIDGAGEPVVIEFVLRSRAAREVRGLLHAARRHDAQQSVEERTARDHRLVQRLGERLVRGHVYVESLE